MRNNVGSLMWDLDERYEFFESSTLDGRDSNNRYFPINRKRIVQPWSKEYHLIENLSGRGDCNYRSKTMCVSFDATCVERVSPNRAVNPTTGLVSRIGEGSGLQKHLSRVRDRRRVNEYVTTFLRSSHLDLVILSRRGNLQSDDALLLHRRLSIESRVRGKKLILISLMNAYVKLNNRSFLRSISFDYIYEKLNRL